MKINATKAMINLAANSSGPFALCTRSAIEEVPKDIPSPLTHIVSSAKLEDAIKATGQRVIKGIAIGGNPGVLVVDSDTEASLYDEAILEKGGPIRARGTSHDHADALLQAVYAALRDEAPKAWAAYIKLEANKGEQIGVVAPADPSKIH